MSSTTPSASATRLSVSLRAEGYPLAVAALMNNKAWAEFQMGLLADAEADATAAFEMSQQTFFITFQQPPLYSRKYISSVVGRAWRTRRSRASTSKLLESPLRGRPCSERSAAASAGQEVGDNAP